MRKFIAALLLLLVPVPALAWTALDSFDTYSNGNNWNTLNGGSGWTTAYAATMTGACTATITNTAAYDGTLSAKIDCPSGGGNEGQVLRQFAATTSDTFRIAIQRSTNTGDGLLVRISDSAVAKLCNLFMDNTGNIYVSGASNANVVTGYSANTWYVIDMRFDTAANTCQARANGGAFSTAVGFSGGSGANITNIYFRDLAITNGARVEYFDAISVPASPSVPAQTRYLRMWGGILRLNPGGTYWIH